MAPSRRPRLEDLLPLYAARARVPWEVLEDRAVLVFPKQYGPFERLVARLARGPKHVRVTLDELGTATWLLADGSRTLQQIADELKARLGESVDPAGPRTAAFLQGLRIRGLVDFYEGPASADDSLRGLTREQGFLPVACPKCKAEVRLHEEDAGKRFVCPRCRKLSRASRGG
ncbi:MAG TPA: PqqD family protein [Candidatus Thermoplasmatota archaeon]|nr:PqqD family protein [Candidatus Thermoplasmatota archaeon]